MDLVHVCGQADTGPAPPASLGRASHARESLQRYRRLLVLEAKAGDAAARNMLAQRLADAMCRLRATDGAQAQPQAHGLGGGGEEDERLGGAEEGGEEGVQQHLVGGDVGRCGEIRGDVG